MIKLGSTYTIEDKILDYLQDKNVRVNMWVDGDGYIAKKEVAHDLALIANEGKEVICEGEITAFNDIFIDGWSPDVWFNFKFQDRKIDWNKDKLKVIITLEVME